MNFCQTGDKLAYEFIATDPKLQKASSNMTNAQQRLIGFDPEFQNLGDYIRVITHRIWEEGRIEDIRRYYSDPCIVETPSSVSTSIEDVISGTKSTLAMFPDRELLAEDIIVSGDAKCGFLSSHRIISPMTHRGAGVFGAPTGRKIYARTIADCVCRDNRIIHEWLVRDQAAIAIQLGIEPRALARRLLDERGGWSKPNAGSPPEGYVSEICTEPIAKDYVAAIEELAGSNRGKPKIYDRAIQHFGPSGSVAYGCTDTLAFWTSLFSALHPNEIVLEHLAYQSGEGKPDRVAARWRANCTHVGDGRYGDPTEKSVELMAICHAEFIGRQLVREWVLIDEIAIWMQVLR